MKQYKVIIDKRALKFIAKQTRQRQQQLFDAIHKLPHEGDIDTMEGYKDRFRLRVGGYRVIYTVQHDIITVCVLDIGNRGDIYK